MLTVDCSPLITPPHILSRLAIAQHTNKVCWVKYSVGTENFEEYLQMSNDRIVKLERIEEKNSLCQVDDRGRLTTVCSSLAERMKWISRSHGELLALMLSRRQFERVLHRSDELP